MSLYFGENLPNWPSIVHFYLRKLYLCTILSENHQEGEQIIFMDIRVLLYPNNRTKTDFLMSLYFGENLPNWPSIVHFYFRKLEFAPFYRKITKRESKSFSWILEDSLMQIIVRKQILLMSLYFGGNLPN